VARMVCGRPAPSPAVSRPATPSPDRDDADRARRRRDGVILAPAIGGAVGAAHEQPMQHGKEDGTLQRKLVSALAGEIGDDRAAAGLLPPSAARTPMPVRSDAPRS